MTSREEEINKYKVAYSYEWYGMGPARKAAAIRHLMQLPIRGSLLDVGCGRGEILDIAAQLDFNPVVGVDPATAEFKPNIFYGEAHNLPYHENTFDVVTCFDVLEHLLEDDIILALKEFNCVAKNYVVIAAADYPHIDHNTGVNYHISYRPDNEWEILFKNEFKKVIKLPKYGSITSTWLMEK